MNADSIHVPARGEKVEEARLPIEIFREGNTFVAHCPALRLASHGPTPDKAESALKAAVDIFFEEIQRMGTLEGALLECGWQKVQPDTTGQARLVPPTITTRDIAVPSSIPLPA